MTANISSKSRSNPYVFTEQGVYMLMTVLKGKLAVRQSIAYVVDNYIELRTLVHLKNSPTGVNITLFSDNVGNNKLHNIEYTDFCKNTVNATGHKCTFRRNIEQSQIDDMLAKLITAMTKEGKFKDAIQDKIGATVDTTDLEKQLSVLNTSLHQAETIKPRLERQMDNLDVTDTHYGKKISDLQRRLDV